jgi:hypothetical protein
MMMAVSSFTLALSPNTEGTFTTSVLYYAVRISAGLAVLLAGTCYVFLQRLNAKAGTQPLPSKSVPTLHLSVRHTLYALLSQVVVTKNHHHHRGHAVAQLVEELRYKPEGRGFDSRLT